MMATRLLGRYARLLCRASFQAPAVASSSSSSSRRLPPPSELLRPQGWTRVTEISMCEQIHKTVEQEAAAFSFAATMQERSELDKMLDEATTPADVLQVWEEHGRNCNHAAAALVKWSILMMKSKDKINNKILDSRVRDMLNTISKQVSRVWNSNLVSILKVLWILNNPSAEPILRSIQTEILWRIRKLSYKQLAQVVDVGIYRKNQQDMALVDTVLKQLELRWTEIADTKTVSALIAKGQHMSPTMMNRLEDKALELAENFSAEEIRRVFLSLAAERRRSIPLLRALSYHLLQKQSSEFTTPLLMDVAYVYGKLNFQQTQVFQRMSSELLPRIPTLDAVDVTRYAKSFGFLKWLHVPLFEAFAEHYTKNSETYRVAQVCNLLMTFARLGFQPSQGQQFFSKVHSVLDTSLSDLELFQRTDVVWSLCILQQAKPQYLINIMQQNHINKILSDNKTRVENYRLKLLHIAATLHLEHSCSSNSDLSCLNVSSVAATVSPVRSSLKEALHNFVDERKEALRTGVNTVYGWTIDGELVFDCDNKPINMSKLKAPHLPKGGGDQDLPAGAHRVAFLAWEYPNFCSKSRDLLGRFTMMKRHIQLAGFIVVEVPYYEWLELKTDWQKSAYLKDKLGKAVAQVMAK